MTTDQLAHLWQLASDYPALRDTADDVSGFGIREHCADVERELASSVIGLLEEIKRLQTELLGGDIAEPPPIVAGEPLPAWVRENVEWLNNSEFRTVRWFDLEDLAKAGEAGLSRFDCTHGAFLTVCKFATHFKDSEGYDCYRITPAGALALTVEGEGWEILE